MGATELRDGWIVWSCDHPMCDESVEFRPTLEETAAIEVPTGATAPEGWGLDVTETPGKPGRGPWHYCPKHAADPTAQSPR